MISLADAVGKVLHAQASAGKPLAIVLAGHNGSGKSTMWHRHLSDRLQLPLINADRMMLSILPEPTNGRLAGWAARLRDSDAGWMGVAQQGVQAFVGHTMGAKVPFAMETVFSLWRELADGGVESKIDLIRDMQAAGYFVLLLFVGLQSADLSILRVGTRVAAGGHDVPAPKLRERFPRTQKAVAAAAVVADATVMADNSRRENEAFTVCRVQLGATRLFDIRDAGRPVPGVILDWLSVVSPVA